MALQWLVRVWRGEPEAAIEHAVRAMRLSPHDPQIFGMQSAIAAAHFFAGRCDEALPWAEMSIREGPDYVPSCSCGGGQRCIDREPRGSGKSHGPLASPHARSTYFQSHRFVSAPATGRLQSVGRRHAKGRAAGMKGSHTAMGGEASHCQVALRNTTARLFAGISATSIRSRPFCSATLTTASKSRKPHSGFCRRSWASNASLLGAVSRSNRRNGP